MKALELHDQRHLEAAQGWFELGNCIEATEELDQITPEMRGHPSVLEVRFHIYAAAVSAGEDFRQSRRLRNRAFLGAMVALASWQAL